jgi:UDP-N-acetylmuramoyl-tripeptide--D-alanyl-D-alanine ligase
MQLTKEFITKVIPNVSFLCETFPKNPSFSIDTRSIKNDEIFIALEGKQTDGHNFIKQAIEKGSGGLIIAENKKDFLQNLSKEQLKNKLIVLVPDTYNALINLATAWRNQFEYPVIGITGSVGKTSTKEMLVNILRMHGVSHLVSHGNQNSRFGLPLNILRMNSEHKIAIFEMGINRRGEMAKLTAIAKPTIAVVTNVGHCHMEGLGSINDIAAEKREIFSQFKEDNIGIVNGDQALLTNVAYSHPVIKFGAKTINQVQARKIIILGTKIKFTLKLYGQKYAVTIPKNHMGAVFNALAAASVAHLLTIPAKSIIAGLEQRIVGAGRFEERSLKDGKGVIINDCYNANPESMKAALTAFNLIETNAQKIVVLGDMFELGVNSPFWHRQIGRFLRKVPTLRKVILVGSQVKWTQKTIPVGVEVELVPSWHEASAKLKEKLTDESLVLVKGSFGMQLTNLVEELT